MSSFSRNRRSTNSPRRLRALGTVLALTLVSGAALADGAHPFHFTAYVDAPGGDDVVAGHYQAALVELKRRSGNMDLDSAETNTNRCVAYAMTRQWQQARVACDAAVRAAKERRNMSPSWWTWAPTPADDDLACAYANRAVLHWLSQDDAAAQKDLAKAAELSPQASFVAQNVVALRIHHAVTLAAASAPRS